MSNLPPPPPFSSGPPPPPPPGPAGPWPSTPVWPTSVRSTGGLRTAATVLMWCSVATSAGVTAAAYSRKGIVADFFDGSKQISDVDDADSLVSALSGLEIALAIAIAIVLAVWSYRTVSNGNARGASARPGLAAGGWFIPIGWYWVGFGQLRRAMTRSTSTALGWWQGTFIVGHLATRYAAVRGRDISDPDPFTSQDDFLNTLNSQNVALTVAVLLMAVAAGFATKALRDVDRDTTSG